MKKLCLAFVLFSLVVLNTEAQRAGMARDKPDAERIAERMTERMAKTLDLSEEQRKEVYAIQLESATQRVQEMESRRDKMRTSNQEDQKKLEAILTPEQKAKWEASKKEVRGKRGQRHEGRRGSGGERKREHRQQIDA